MHPAMINERFDLIIVTTQRNLLSTDVSNISVVNSSFFNINIMVNSKLEKETGVDQNLSLISGADRGVNLSDYLRGK